MSPTRDAEAAKRFFCKALQHPAYSASGASEGEEQVAKSFGTETLKAAKPAPRVINVDKNAAYPKAIADLKATGVLPESVELRRVKYLNNLIEQDQLLTQTLDETWDGLLFVRDGMENITRF